MRNNDEEDDMPKVAPFKPLSVRFKIKEEKRIKEDNIKKKKQIVIDLKANELREQKKAEVEEVKVTKTEIIVTA